MKGYLNLACVAIALSAASAQAQIALEQEARPDGIEVRMTDEGVVFTDARGMTLYFGSDPKPGVSTCTNKVYRQGVTGNGDIYDIANYDRVPSCVDKTPPAAAGSAKPVGRWTIIDRADGIRQWAYDNRPLYTSIKDVAPGDVNAGGRRGDGDAALAPLILPSEVRVDRLGVSRIVVRNDGRTLYTSQNDSRGKSNCNAQCVLVWQPLAAPSAARARGDWTIVVREDQSRQWAFKGKPLYTYGGDINAGDARGEENAGWDVVLAYPKPSLPDALSVRDTAMGKRYSDASGKTVYYFTCGSRLKTDDGTQQSLACDDPGDKSLWWTATCTNEQTCADIWRPVLASANAKPQGTTWTIVDMPLPWAPVRTLDPAQKSVKVWAYNGRPLFTYKFEERPGMIDGHRVGIYTLTNMLAIDARGEVGPASQRSVASR